MCLGHAIGTDVDVHSQRGGEGRTLGNKRTIGGSTTCHDQRDSDSVFSVQCPQSIGFVIADRNQRMKVSGLPDESAMSDRHANVVSLAPDQQARPRIESPELLAGNDKLVQC